jgi:class 3 adenylate cyclase
LARVKTHLAVRAALDGVRREKQNADRLLEVVLPRAAADELRATERVASRRIEGAAVLFAELVGFAAWSDAHAPEEVVPTLHRVFLELEGIARAHGLEKLKTIGNQFMAGAGLLTESEQPLLDGVRAGLDMVTAVGGLVNGWQARVGVNVGPVVAGIVGGERFQFDVWGDTVNVAARLAANGTPGVVTIPASLAGTLHGRVTARPVGSRFLKGKGAVELVEILVD